MTRTEQLERRVRLLLLLFITGLVVSGLTAFPLVTELRWLTGALGTGPETRPQEVTGVLRWLVTVRDALIATNASYPFLAYGTDWLAFAHLVIAVAFVGPWRDPVRNRWVVTFGLIACAGVIPLALVAGAVRGIPLYWRLIDCAFGVAGAALLWPCARAIQELEASSGGAVPNESLQPRGCTVTVPKKPSEQRDERSDSCPNPARRPGPRRPVDGSTSRSPRRCSTILARSMRALAVKSPSSGANPSASGS